MRLKTPLDVLNHIDDTQSPQAARTVAEAFLSATSVDHYPHWESQLVAVFNYLRKTTCGCYERYLELLREETGAHKWDPEELQDGARDYLGIERL